MASLSFEESLQLQEVSPDVYQNVHEPWCWPNSDTVPGPVLMSEAAAAAYRTIPKDYVLDNLQTQFLGKPNAKVPMIFRVVRLSNGGRFAVRAVTIEQNGTKLLHTLISFVNSAPWNGPSMRHTSYRKTKHEIQSITLDDLEVGRNHLGSCMRFQRLGLTFRDASESVESGIATIAAHIIGPIQDQSLTSHMLGIVSLSDYHVMDTPLHLNKYKFGLPAIGDMSRRPTENDLKIGTSLNHTIHFHRHDGFRADDLTYIEVETSWASDGRAMLHSNIFSQTGLLIATCSQEAFYVLKKDPPAKSSSKL